MTRFIRWSLGGSMALLLAVFVGGCAQNKLQAERNQLLQQNQQLQQQLREAKAGLASTRAQLAQQQQIAAAAQQAAQAQQAASTQAARSTGYTTMLPTFRNRTSAGARVAPRRLVRHRRREMHRFVLSSDLLFASASARLQPRSLHVLLHVAYLLRTRYARRRIRIEGFTDNRPIHHPYRNNYLLGLARARSVENFLARHGISRRRMKAVSFGDHDMVSTTDLALDRRVEIVVLR